MNKIEVKKLIGIRDFLIAAREKKDYELLEDFEKFIRDIADDEEMLNTMSENYSTEDLLYCRGFLNDIEEKFNQEIENDAHNLIPPYYAYYEIKDTEEYTLKLSCLTELCEWAFNTHKIIEEERPLYDVIKCIRSCIDYIVDFDDISDSLRDFIGSIIDCIYDIIFPEED